MTETMMAANLHAPADLRYEAVPLPLCASDEILVNIKYCGICGSDVARVLKKGTYHFPTIPGHEFSGIVVQDPMGELVGQRVTVFPLLPCKQCSMCHQGLYELCSDYDYYGSRRDGGFAEYLAVKRWNLLALPDNVSFEEGAMTEPAAVAHHAVARLGLHVGDSVLISGAGPIALLTAQWMRLFGAEKVYLFDIVPEKIAFAKQMGFLEYQDGIPVDAALEGTGFSDALQRCLAAVRPHGKLVLMGNPSRNVEMTPATYWHILRKELFVTGTWNSSFGSNHDDWHAVLRAMSDKKLSVRPLISHIYPLSQCNDAFQMLAEHREFSNRVLLKAGE